MGFEIDQYPGGPPGPMRPRGGRGRMPNYPQTAPTLDRYRANANRQTFNRAMRNNELDAEKQRAVFIHAVEKAAARHPEIPEEVWRDIISAHDAEFEKYKDTIRLMTHSPRDRQQHLQELSDARQNMLSNVQNRIRKHGEQGQKALQAIGSERGQDNFYSPIVRMFYDSDKGGLQIGGALGALAGGIGSFMIAGNSGISGIFQFLIAGAATLVGAYVGNKVLPNQSTLQTPNFQTPMKRDEPNRRTARTRDIGDEALRMTAEPSRDPERIRTAMGDASVAPGAQPAPLTGGESNGFTYSGIPGSNPGNRRR